MPRSEENNEQEIWGPSESLSPRVKKLRDEYENIMEREFRNEMIPFSSGSGNDVLWSPVLWGVVPELMPFNKSFMETTPLLAKKVCLSDDFWEMPHILRVANFFRTVVNRYLPVSILDGELIVGSHFNALLSRVHTKREYKRWKKKTARWLKELEHLDSFGMGNAGATPGHIIPNYAKVIGEGLKGRVEYFGKLHDSTVDENHRYFLEALIICCEAARDFARRYATLARELQKSCGDEERKKELLEIERICDKVPWEPASTFQEALQSLWFLHMLVMTQESYPGPGLSFGRIDQYLYPYYEKDIKDGRITRGLAKELLECFWIKPNYAYDFMYRVGKTRGITSGYGQLATIGGHGPDGEDASNDLTWLILEVIEEMNLLEPKPNIRIHKGSPRELLKRISEMVGDCQGSPFIINFDEASIRGLKWQGLPEKELWDYAPVGCLENTLQGGDRSGTVDVNVNLAKAVELTLTGGRDMATGKRLGPRTGDVRGFQNWEEFKSAFEKQLRSLLAKFIDFYNLADGIRAEFEPTPYLSTLVDGCAEKGKDVTNAGAVHNFVTVEGVAFATASDSLTAIKKLVYEEKQISMEELIKALRNNFEGYEKLRQILINKAPKYGNDDDYADEVARYLSRLWTEEVFKHETPTGKRYRGGYLSWNYWIAYAPKTAATPDGRKRGTYLSNGVCPVNGTDRNGPTALACSVGKLGLESAPNGDSHTISLNPSLLRGEERIEKLSSFLLGYDEHGGTALQVNMIDAETLRLAQGNPDEYRNLLVRVTGYNAYFVTLGKEIQEEIIARESHGM
ncbi:MAG: pyruvate formate lyase family protein [Actinomycetota bacterium]|nr:pyruvate formate lyase family protein [Actinomycetota bacterium]